MIDILCNDINEPNHNNELKDLNETICPTPICSYWINERSSKTQRAHLNANSQYLKCVSQVFPRYRKVTEFLNP